jgi:hypothetical protein
MPPVYEGADTDCTFYRPLTLPIMKPLPPRQRGRGRAFETLGRTLPSPRRVIDNPTLAPLRKDAVLNKTRYLLSKTQSPPNRPAPERPEQL